MKQLRVTLAILSVHFLTWLMRRLGSGGTSLPGKVALKICPDLPERLAPQFRIHMVTGTNGKTTTSRMIARLLEEAGIAYQTNKSGANLASGITATLACACTPSGRATVGTLLIEADEAAFRIMGPKLKPATLIATNFFRDQLDRYGELYTTLNGVRAGIAGSPGTVLVLNADDSLCASLGLDVENQVCCFGLDREVLTETTEPGSSDAAFCIRCKTRYEYDGRSYGHLGHFRCPACGFTRPETLVSVSRIMQEGSASSTVCLSLPSGKAAATVNLPGRYNIYNALAAATLSEVLGLPSKALTKALATFECGFGRMESIEADGREIKVILVKNPTGFNQVLRFMAADTAGSTAVFLINDRLADGTDISWLWDVDFEQLADVQQNFRHFYASGIRAGDMGIRLKYAGIFKDRITRIDDLNVLLDEALRATAPGASVYVMPTYTAMLALRSRLKKRYRLKDFWK